MKPPSAFVLSCVAAAQHLHNYYLVLCVVLELLLLPLAVSWLLESDHSLSQYYPSLQEITLEILSKPALEFQIYSSVLQNCVSSTNPHAFLLYFLVKPFNGRD